MKARRTLTVIVQVLVGLLFIISGLIKANDPMGFGYKLQEYFSVFTEDLPSWGGLFAFFGNNATFLAIVICTIEIFVGICLFLGVFRRFTAWILLLMIIFFTFLTFYSAKYNKVTDCGCFGDALKLTPWQSFSKDVVLLVLSLILFLNWRFIRPMFTSPRMGNRIAIGGGLLALFFSLYCVYYLPVIDFRPYKPGNDIEALMHSPKDTMKKNEKIYFLYKNKKDSNLVKRYSIDSLSYIDTNYRFSSRIQPEVKKEDLPPVHDFDIAGPDSSLTYTFLHQKGYRLMIVSYLLDKANTGVQDKLNSLVTVLNQEGRVKVWAVTSSPEAERKIYIERYHVPYPMYTMDGTTLKTMIRSNPGLILFRGNVVVKNWPSTALPTKERLMEYVK